MAKLQNPPPTYTEITAYCKKMFGFKPEPCWIADVKKQMGYKVKPAWNRQGEKRVCPCPENKIEYMRKAIMNSGSGD